MCIEGSAVDLADADGNVGAVVGNPFEVGHHIGKDKTKLDRAFSTLEPFDVVVLQAGIQAVNHLLEWFHFICFFYILIVENGEGQAHLYHKHSHFVYSKSVYVVFEYLEGHFV